MRWDKKNFLMLFVIITTFIAIVFNIPKSFMGDHATLFNFIVSMTFLLSWFLFSFCHGKKLNKKYLKFILIYWVINIISNVLIIIFLINNYEGTWLFPLSIWYTTPVYGLDYILNGNYKTIFLATMPLGLIFSGVGYWIGFTSAKKKY